MCKRFGIRQLGPTFCAAVLCACGSDAVQSRFDDYRTRLAHSLGHDTTPTVELVAPARRPRKRDMLLGTDDSQISMLDFLRLNDCALGEVIGKRNSVLGKVAPASQRLFIDLDFLRLAPDCIAELRAGNSVALADKVREAVEIKRDGLAAAIANATIASDEFTGFWRIPASLGETPANDGSFLIAELEYVESEVARWLSGDYQHDSSRFEKVLGKLRNGKAGSLIAAAVLTRTQLDAANRMLRSRHDADPLCKAGEASMQGRIVQQVIAEDFSGGLQRWISRVNARQRDLLGPYRLLEDHLATAQSPAYRRWRQQRDTQLAWLSSVSRHHVKVISQSLASCDRAP